jgi:ribosomal protein S21
MPVKVIRNAKESVDRLIARFNKKMQSSRIIVQLKARRYHKRPLRKREVRAAAVMRDMHRSKREKLKFY